MSSNTYIDIIKQWVRFAWVQATISACKTGFSHTVHNTMLRKPVHSADISFGK